MNVRENTQTIHQSVCNPQYLYDVCLLRLMLILLLVFYHSFCIFCDAWPVPSGFPKNEIYWWMAKVPISFFLEVFTFISGYILGYQVSCKGETQITFNNCVVKKVRRLLFPCVFFSTIYLLLMGNFNLFPLEFLYKIVNGFGHLWYLPMLFWCFVIIWLIEYIKIKPKYMLPLLFFCSIILSLKNMPLRVDEAIYYIFFFYIGYVINRYDINMDKYYTGKYVFIFALLYGCFFVALHLFFYNKSFADDNFVMNITYMILEKLAHFVCSFLALAFAYVIVHVMLKKNGFIVKTWMVNVSNLCYGVYIYHQIFIDFAYYRMGWIEIFPPMLLPWIGLITALIFSLSLTYFTLKTKIGRFLIG